MNSWRRPQLEVRSKSCGASLVLSTVPVDARAEMTWTPGAVTVGWYSGSPGTPRDEKSASIPPGWQWSRCANVSVAEQLAAMPIRFDPGATPVYSPFDIVPLPPAIPDTCVPCPTEVSLLGRFST